MPEADVRDEGRDPEARGVGGDGGQDGQAVRGHPRQRVVGRRAGEEEVIALDDAGHSERLELSRLVLRRIAVVRARAGPRQRNPDLDHGPRPRTRDAQRLAETRRTPTS